MIKQRIGLLVEQRYLAQAQPGGLQAALQARGRQVTAITPEATAHALGESDWLAPLDLVVGRGRSCSLLCRLAEAETRGWPTVNRSTAIAAVHNKAEMAVRLAASGLPTPPTFLGPVASLAGQVAAAHYPLIVKPVFGDNGRGLRIVQNPDELAGLNWPEPLALAQPYLPNDGYDLKLYGIGDEIWAVRKLSPLGQPAPAPCSVARNSTAQVEALPVTPTWRALARRCGELFGLLFYGVDCLETPAGLVVIEVNDFPNYTGVPTASAKLADFLLALATAQRRVR